MNRKNVDPTLFSEKDIRDMTQAVEEAGASARKKVAGWKDRSTTLGLSLVRSVRPFHIRKQRNGDTEESTQQRTKYVVISLDEETSL